METAVVVGVAAGVGLLVILGILFYALARVEGAVRTLESRNAAAEAALARDLGEARRSVAELLAREASRRRLEEELWASARRVEGVLAGSRSRGEAGENILQEAFRAFPPGMIEQNFRVRGRPVEYALVLSSGRRLPIDSKWPAADLLARLEEEVDAARRAELVQELERTVVRKAREVAQYLDPATTLPWGVAAVPDGVFALCRRAHWEAFRENVLIVPYSMALPYLLSLYSLHLRHGRTVDQESLDAVIERLGRCLDGLDRVLENGLARGATMVGNAYTESRRLAGEMRGMLAQLGALPPDGAGAAAPPAPAAAAPPPAPAAGAASPSAPASSASAAPPAGG